MLKREGSFQTQNVERQVLPDVVLLNMYEEIQDLAPHAQFSLLVNQRTPRLGHEPKQETLMFGRFSRRNNELPVYYASTIKPVIVAAAAEYATKKDIKPDDPTWRVECTETLIQEYYDDVLGEPTYPESEPTMKRVSGFINDPDRPILHPKLIDFQEKLGTLDFSQSAIEKLDDELHSFYGREDIPLGQWFFMRGLFLEHMRRRQPTEQNEETYKHFITYLDTVKKHGKDYIGNTSLQKLIVAALGPSSNAATSIISKNLGFFAEYTDSNAGPNAVQNFVDRMIGEKSTLTINNARKEEKTGYWNAGKQSELMRLYGMILDGDEKLGISEDYTRMILSALEQYQADPVIEMAPRIRKSNPEVTVHEKSGYYTLDLQPGKYDSMPRLMRVHGWDKLAFDKVTVIDDMLRVSFPDGKIIDLAFSISYPHEVQNSEAAQAQKAILSYIVTETLLELFQIE